jgi:DHA1 family bicyclomycin/chloramphenicol resistance-like MFS transporter
MYENLEGMKLALSLNFFKKRQGVWMSQEIKSTFNGKIPPIGSLILIISMASIGSVLFTPGLAQMAAFFNVSISTAQYAMTIYVLGYAIAQLLHGPLTNQFGRKTVLLWGTTLSIIFSLLSGLSKPLDSITLLMISRFLTALSSGVGLVVSLTMISDVFTEKKTAQIVPITAISFAVLPGVAICLGGFIVEYLGWEWSFYILASYYLVSLIFASTLSETLPENAKKKLHLRSVINHYLLLLSDSRLLTFASMVGLTSIFVYVYAAVAPVVAIQDLGLRASTYGMLSLAPFVFYATGNLITSALNKRQFPMRTSIATAFISITLVSVIFFANVLAHELNIVFFYVIMCLIFLFIPIIWSNASVKATRQIVDKANSSAVLSFINVTGCFIGLLLVAGTSFLAKPLSMASVFLLTTLVLLVLGIRNHIKYPL